MATTSNVDNTDNKDNNKDENNIDEPVTPAIERDEWGEPIKSEPDETVDEIADKVADRANEPDLQTATPHKNEKAKTALLYIVAALIVVIIAGILIFAVSRCGTARVDISSDTTETTEPASSNATDSLTPEATPAAAPLSQPSSDTLALEETIQQTIGDVADSVSVTYLRVNDASDGFAINGDVSHISASMIKLIILADLFEQANQGIVSLDDTLELTEDDIVAGSGVLQGAAIGSTYTLRELAFYMITESDNIAANMLIDTLGMDNINAEAANLGLTQTSLQRRMMDTDAQAAGLENYMSSNDAATILQMIASGTLVNAEYSEIAADMLKQQTVDSGLASGVINAGGTDAVVAHKTGELVNVEHDGGIIYLPSADNSYVLVVMTEGIGNGDAMSLIQAISSLAYESASESTQASVVDSAAIAANAADAQTETSGAIVESEEEAAALQDATAQDAELQEQGQEQAVQEVEGVQEDDIVSEATPDLDVATPDVAADAESM